MFHRVGQVPRKEAEAVADFRWLLRCTPVAIDRKMILIQRSTVKRRPTRRRMPAIESSGFWKGGAKASTSLESLQCHALLAAYLKLSEDQRRRRGHGRFLSTPSRIAPYRRTVAPLARCGHDAGRTEDNPRQRSQPADRPLDRPFASGSRASLRRMRYPFGGHDLAGDARACGPDSARALGSSLQCLAHYHAHCQKRLCYHFLLVVHGLRNLRQEVVFLWRVAIPTVAQAFDVQVEIPF